jgi:hypothetical protein
LLLEGEARFKYLINVTKGWNKDQIDSCSRYFHSLSLAVLLSIAGLPFSGAEIIEYALKASILLALSIGLFLLGAHLLKGQKNV